MAKDVKREALKEKRVGEKYKSRKVKSINTPPTPSGMAAILKALKNK